MLAGCGMKWSLKWKSVGLCFGRRKDKVFLDLAFRTIWDYTILPMEGEHMSVIW